MILGMDKRQSVVTFLPDKLRARARECVGSVSVESRNCLLLDSFRYRAETEQEPSRNRAGTEQKPCSMAVEELNKPCQRTIHSHTAG